MGLRHAPAPEAPPGHLLEVLQRAWSSPFTTSADFSRKNADLIAEAACRNLITTKEINSSEWGRIWRITATGLQLLETNVHE